VTFSDRISRLAAMSGVDSKFSQAIVIYLTQYCH
jgi:hypothetical protein